MEKALLLTTVLLPAAGTLLVEGSRAGPLPVEGGCAGPRRSALVTTLFTLALASLLIARYPAGHGAFALIEFPWLGAASSIDVRFSLGLDGLGLWLFGLTALLMVVAVLVSWEAIRERAATFYSLLLLLETGMLGVFVARDIILFYVFFEFTLIPLFFLIGVWGSEERRRAAVKFFLFTLAGSVLTFLGLLAIVVWSYYHSPSGRLTFSIPQLTANLAMRPMDKTLQLWVFGALFAGFAIKVPLFPLHTWLPLAHVQAPTAGSVILAGVLLKVGAYGFLRFSVPMLPDATAAWMPWLLGLSAAGILYGGLVALAQQDIKRLIAYSSVSHLGFCTLGIFALNPLGLQGGTLQLINHGLSTGGLFAVVGMLYERYHTRQIKDLGGLAARTPVLAFFMLLLTLSSIGLPGLNGFAGEFLLLIGMFQRGWADAPAAWAGPLRVAAVLSVAGVVLGAWYMLQLVQRVFFGPLREPQPGGEHAMPQPGPQQPAQQQPAVRDLSFREVAALAPLAVFIFWIGLWPEFFLARMTPTLDRLAGPAMQLACGRVQGSGVGKYRLACGERSGGIGERRLGLKESPPTAFGGVRSLTSSAPIATESPRLQSDSWRPKQYGTVHRHDSRDKIPPIAIGFLASEAVRNGAPPRQSRQDPPDCNRGALGSSRNLPLTSHFALSTFHFALCTSLALPPPPQLLPPTANHQPPTSSEGACHAD